MRPKDKIIEEEHERREQMHQAIDSIEAFMNEKY